MKNIFRKSTVLFMAMAVFAMIFVGCSNDSSSSGSGSGGGGGVNPPTTNYGTVQIGDETYEIALGGFEIYYDEDLQDNVCLLAVADASEEYIFAVNIPYRSTIPDGIFPISIEDPMPDGKCAAMFQAGEDNLLVCVSGNVKITKVGTNYKIESTGTATPMSGGRDVSFSVNFQGPLTEYND